MARNATSGTILLWSGSSPVCNMNGSVADCTEPGRWPIADVREYVAVYHNSKNLPSTLGFKTSMRHEKNINNHMLRTAILATLTLGALILWRYIYPYTCLSLLIPLLFATVICTGRFNANMHRRRYWASYYLKERSWLYHLVTGKTFSMFRAIITGTVYAFSLSAFTALGGAFEIIMLFLNGLLALILHPIYSDFIQRHAAIGVANHATKRLLTLSCFTITAIIYIAILLNTKVPDYIEPTSLRASVNAASQQVASLCPFTNISLKGVQEFTATQWFYMVTSTGFLESPLIKYASWLVFLGYSSLAIMGMSLLSAELTVYSSQRATTLED